MTRANRREFLWLSLAALPLVRHDGRGAPAAPLGRTLFLSESGQFDQDRWLVGALVVDDPLRFARDLRALRLRLKYYRQLRAGSTDRYRLTFGQEVIREILTNSGLRFVARRLAGATRDEYLAAYRAVVSAGLGDKTSHVLVTFHKAPVESATLLAEIRRAAGAPNVVADLSDIDRAGFVVDAPKPAAPFQIAESDIPDISAWLAKLMLGKRGDALRAFLEAERASSPAKAAKVTLV